MNEYGELSRGESVSGGKERIMRCEEDGCMLHLSVYISIHTHTHTHVHICMKAM
jgi:hypothetical protein